MFLVRTAKQGRAALFLLLSLTIPAGLPAPSEAHSGGGRVFPIAELTDGMLERIQLDDGTVDEWFDLVGEPTLTGLDFIDFWGREPPDPSDFDFRIWLTWHGEPARLYLAFVASDDRYQNTHDYSSDDILSRFMIFGDNDALTLGIDGDHSGGSGLPVSGVPAEGVGTAMREQSGETQYYEAISRTNGPNLVDYTGQVIEDLSWRGLPPYADAGGGVAGEAPVIWVIELYVTPFDHGGEPWDSPEGSEVSDLAAGQFIGFAIGVQDFDSGSRATAEFDMTQWVPEGVEYSANGTFSDIRRHRADYFLDGLLLRPARPVPNPKAARSSRFPWAGSRPRCGSSHPSAHACSSQCARSGRERILLPGRRGHLRRKPGRVL